MVKIIFRVVQPSLDSVTFQHIALHGFRLFRSRDLDGLACWQSSRHGRSNLASCLLERNLTRSVADSNPFSLYRRDRVLCSILIALCWLALCQGIASNSGSSAGFSECDVSLIGGEVGAGVRQDFVLVASGSRSFDAENETETRRDSRPV